ncbi:hypothetical protein O6H91_01G168700 [Diphasiastrum complanatum]|uniref:Uncharacterized protein n=1 Tax=Diphasiastrum complanatum TaxID=34168 RepID=A0ACC2EYM1_DIPCM|nr:hypothetical protein O6H91_01G168700 [Diphasiastrum complanatum]
MKLNDLSSVCRLSTDALNIINFLYVQTRVMHADALMKINELDHALIVYEEAWSGSREDSTIVRKIGQALVSNHNYAKAIEHYEFALRIINKNLCSFYIWHDLAELYFKLRHFERAESLLNDLVTRVQDGRIQEKCMNSPKAHEMIISSFLLLLTIRKLLGKHDRTSEVMLKVKNLQRSFSSKFQKQHKDYKENDEHTSANIYFELSQKCQRQKDVENAIVFLNEALKCNSVHTAAAFALAKILLSRGDLGECEQKCATLLRADPSNTEAADILVHLMLHREHYESAIVHFQQVIEHKPNDYRALGQLIRLFRRTGKLEEALPYIQNAIKAAPNYRTQAGLYYCQGLVAHFSNDSCEALQMLNNARADAEWGKMAIHLMVEIYINMDNEMLLNKADVEDPRNCNVESLQSAHKLLTESRFLVGKAVKQTVLECYVLMATKAKADVERALCRLHETEAQKEDQVLIMLAIAIGLTILRQSAKAKTQLRSIDKLVYKWDEGDDFEHAWLMLANVHMQAGKLDVAEQLCKKCLKYNKSCAKALEYLGVLKEKGHAYIEAIGFYQSAWKYSRATSASIGYRLASIYLKEKMYVEAILICKEVIKNHSFCQKIKKDILDKAQKALCP